MNQTEDRRRPGAGRLAGGVALLLLLWTTPAAAQTDYYNLDKERPLRVEDAYAAERYVVEFQLSPLTLAGADGVLRYTPSLELKYGLLPGVEVSAGLEAAWTRRDGETTGGLEGLELSALYNLNTETLGIPAFAVRATGHVPFESDERGTLELRGIVTRVLGGPWRAHVNGAAVLGGHAAERWWAGLAVDHVLPFRALLLMGEAYYAQPRDGDLDGRVHSAIGFRWQLTPWTLVDAGAGRDWGGTNGDDWRVTLGVTTAMGLRPLMRVR